MDGLLVRCKSHMSAGNVIKPQIKMATDKSKPREFRMSNKFAFSPNSMLLSANLEYSRTVSPRKPQAA